MTDLLPDERFMRLALKKALARVRKRQTPYGSGTVRAWAATPRHRFY